MLFVTFLFFPTVFFVLLQDRLELKDHVELSEQYDGLWAFKSWEKVPVGSWQERLTLFAWAVEQLANSLDLLNLLLVSVFAVVVDARQFPTSIWVLLSLTTVVVLSSFPPRFGTGLVFYSFEARPDKPAERLVVIGLFRKTFWLMRLGCLALEMLQMILAGLPFNCEVGGATASYCKHVNTTVIDVASVIVAEPATLFVLSISLAEAAVRIVSLVIFLVLVFVDRDAAWHTFRAFRGSVPDIEPNLRLMLAAGRITLPNDRMYIARHIYRLEPYQSLRFDPHLLLAAGIIPDVFMQKGLQEDIVSADHVYLSSNGESKPASGGWHSYFFLMASYRYLRSEPHLQPEKVNAIVEYVSRLPDIGDTTRKLLRAIIRAEEKNTPLTELEVQEAFKLLVVEEEDSKQTAERKGKLRAAAMELGNLKEDDDGKLKAVLENALALNDGSDTWKKWVRFLYYARCRGRVEYVVSQVLQGSRSDNRLWDLHPFLLDELPEYRKLITNASL